MSDMIDALTMFESSILFMYLKLGPQLEQFVNMNELTEILQDSGSYNMLWEITGILSPKQSLKWLVIQFVPV